MKIIAEVGSNVKSLVDCMNSVVMAKKCGADAVKFQYFTDQEMFGFDCNNRPMLAADWLPKIKQKADQVGIEFMCTFFSPASLHRFNDLIKTIKIASSDLLYEDLLEQAKMMNKPVICSTGGHSLADCKHVVRFMKGYDLTLMYCESAYPARSTDMRKIGLLQGIHDKVGFSDHSLEIYTNPLLARDLGCSVMEKHVDFCGYDDTPDKPHSLNLRQFKEMCDALRSKWPEPVLRSFDEQDMVIYHNRRLVATKFIDEGEQFKYGYNFGAFRSLKSDTNGLAPYYWTKVNGKLSNKKLQIGDSIGPREVGT